MALPPLISHEELDRELYSYFDTQGVGYIEMQDMHWIAKVMGIQSDYSIQLITINSL
jgi:hypothetical protein